MTLDPLLTDVFREEFDQISERLEAVGVRLCDGGTAGDLDEAFRGLHTLKGNCYAMGFDGMGLLAHQYEDVLRSLRDSAASPPAHVGELLLAVNDELRRMVDQPAAPAPEALLARIAEAAGNPSATAVPGPGPVPVPDLAPGITPPVTEESTLTLPVDVADLDALFKSVESFRSRLLSTGSVALARRAEELSRMLLAVRNVPVERVAVRLRRVAREAAKSASRRVTLEVQGEALHADAAVVQDLGVILPHMVRNSIGHGVEPEAERAAAGKPAPGSVRVRFAHEPGAFVVVIDDDGRGLDPDRIAASALRKGVVSPDEVARMSDAERLRLIFHSGVSTADAVTQLSGRGVGMDVVAAVVQRHRARIDVESERGRGTRFTLRFPVLFRWEEYLVVELDRRFVGLPVRTVERILPGGTGDVRPGSEVLPALALRDLDPAAGVTAGRPAVLLSVDGRRCILPVDALVGFSATLVQALPGRDAARCIAGVGQTADGGVLWGVDLEEVARDWERYVVAP